MSLKTLERVPITSGPAFVRGVKYEVANGVQIPNMEQRQFVGRMEDDWMRSLAARACEVNKSFLYCLQGCSGGRIDATHFEENAMNLRSAAHV